MRRRACSRARASPVRKSDSWPVRSFSSRTSRQIAVADCGLGCSLRRTQLAVVSDGAGAATLVVALAGFTGFEQRHADRRLLVAVAVELVRIARRLTALAALGALFQTGDAGLFESAGRGREAQVRSALAVELAGFAQTERLLLAHRVRTQA